MTPISMEPSAARVLPAGVWPWLVQMGYYRAGWYTDAEWWDYRPDRVLRFFARKEAEQTGYAHRDAPSADRIVPDLQHLQTGETVLHGPPGTAFFVARAIELARLLALHSNSHLRYAFPPSIRENAAFGVGGEFMWCVTLDDLGPTGTRLILWTRGMVHPGGTG